jgi:hypothetical protein
MVMESVNGSGSQVLKAIPIWYVVARTRPTQSFSDLQKKKVGVSYIVGMRDQPESLSEWLFEYLSRIYHLRGGCGQLIIFFPTDRPRLHFVNVRATIYQIGMA